MRVELGISQKYTSQMSTNGSRALSYPSFKLSAESTNRNNGVIEEYNANTYNLQARSLAVNITRDVKIDDNPGYLADESRDDAYLDKNTFNLNP